VSAAPDYVEPVVAWRVWYAAEAHGEIRLTSVFHELRWPLREPMRASCMRPRFPVRLRRRLEHAPPSEACQCGIYAAPLERLGSYLGGHFSIHRAYPVIGRVSLWGRVIECTQGWRSAVAYPEHLYVPVLAGRRRGARAAEVALALTAYGVPVELLDAQTPGSIIAELSFYAVAA